MGPYRTNAAPLRARREELRLELDDLETKMTELEIARGCVERSIDDIDVKLQTGFRPPRYRRSIGRSIVVLFALVVGIFSAILLVAVLTAPRPRCVVRGDPSVVFSDGLGDSRRYP